MKEKNQKKMPRGKLLTSEEIAGITALHKEKLTITAIAKRIKKSQNVGWAFTNKKNNSRKARKLGRPNKLRDREGGRVLREVRVTEKSAQSISQV